jgi:hypothetical protein
METTNPQNIAAQGSPEEQLSALFGSYKAEWLRDQLFELFTEPTYFPEMITGRPCMLIGGRGTGKTTVLRSLSYEGRFALTGKRIEDIPTWPYFGIYYRVNTNRVTAFKGPELDEDRWKRTFAHYLNLILCELTVGFLEWFQNNCPNQPSLTPEQCTNISTTLNLPPVENVNKLADLLQLARVSFEAYINNVADKKGPDLSIQGAPIDALAQAILSLVTFQGKLIFFLLDEYENLEDYQQEVVNTLIKHSGQHYTFKIGIRELGWRRRTTLNQNEQLIHPADYVRIDIADKLAGDVFKAFALKVCNDRISRLHLHPTSVPPSVDSLLPGVSEDTEAEIQGVLPFAQAVLDELTPQVTTEQARELSSLSPLERYFFRFWADGQNTGLLNVYQEYLNDRESWKTRFGNYKHALLYTLRKGKRGIQKYYAGWDVFTQLAGANIRYLLELVDQSLVFHLRKQADLNEAIPPRTQTDAAQYVGKKNLSELEGLSVHGAQLTKLLLGLGRVFQRMASDAAGHTPEVTQFHINDLGTLDESSPSSSFEPEVVRLIRSAVMHLALLRAPGNKLGTESETKDYDYMVHPIFCPFFGFSYRKKRKMRLSAQQILGLVHRPAVTIREILQQNNRVPDETLPEQLTLFERFFHGG